MTIGEKIINLRKVSGKSQDEVAKLAGVSRQTLSRWENGDGEPSISDLVSLCKVFGVSLDSFVGNQSSATAAVAQQQQQVIHMQYVSTPAPKTYKLFWLWWLLAAFAVFVTILVSTFVFPGIEGDDVVVTTQIDKAYFVLAVLATAAIWEEAIRRTVLFAKRKKQNKSQQQQKDN